MSEYFVHESSYVDENVKIGQGTKIWHFYTHSKWSSYWIITAPLGQM